MSLSSRHESEKSFFDKLAQKRTTDLTIPPAVIERYINPSPKPIFSKEYMFHLLGDIRGTEILDFGCGEGENTVLLAKKGAFVYSFDISLESVKYALEKADANEVGDRIRLCCMAGEQIAFADDSFDLIFGSAILHHLDFERGIGEVHRILKKGGAAIFREPTVFSANLAGLRKLVPLPTNATPDERQLNEGDLALLKRYFSEVEVTYFKVFSRLERVFLSPPVEYGHGKMQNIQTFFVRLLYKMDYYLLKYIPGMSKFSGGVVVKVRK
ncbi:MAG: class I SAM-dependent methyltransferase [Deltaproteobacteria bacterium]